jgi:hypothetical protein
MIIDVRTWTDEERERFRGSCVFVDECEIPKVWYADTDAGIVKTYAVLTGAPAEVIERVRRWAAGSMVTDRTIFVTQERFPLEILPPEYEIEAPDGGVLSRTLRGVVRIEMSD